MLYKVFLVLIMLLLASPIAYGNSANQHMKSFDLSEFSDLGTNAIADCIIHSPPVFNIAVEGMAPQLLNCIKLSIVSDATDDPAIGDHLIVVAKSPERYLANIELLMTKTSRVEIAAILYDSVETLHGMNAAKRTRVNKAFV